MDRVDLINDKIKDDKELNFLRYIGVSEERKVSVVALYNPDAIKGTKYTLDSNLNAVEVADMSRWYFGVSPRINSDYVVDLIAGLKICDNDAMREVIAESASEFMIRDVDSGKIDVREVLYPMAKYIVLSTAHHYGIYIDAEGELADEFSALEKKFYNIEYIKRTIEVDGKEVEKKYIFVAGCPTTECLSALNRYTYTIDDGEMLHPVTDGSGANIEDIYRAKQVIRLRNENVFYSGVLLRPLMIEMLDERKANKDMIPLRVTFERSTFATVSAFDHVNFNFELLTNEDKVALTKLFVYDDNVARKLHETTYVPSDFNANIGAINDYYAHNLNVNQIGVSGNLITSDNYLIVGARSSKGYDSGTIYPSINGNSEVVDYDVSYYHYSAEEDYPDITLDSHRITFNGELGRETYAEVGIRLDNVKWKCFGMTIMGKRQAARDNSVLYTNGASDNIVSRRMVTNVLFEQDIDYSLREIAKGQKKALESYENSGLRGIRMRYHRNIGAAIASTFRSLMVWLLDNRETIMQFATLALFLTTLTSMSMQSGLELVINVLTIFFAIVVVIATIISIADAIRRRWRMRGKTFKLTLHKSSHLEETLDKKLDKLFAKLHPTPVALFMIYHHIDRVISEGNEQD